jgi:hypothetical protein
MDMKKQQRSSGGETDDKAEAKAGVVMMTASSLSTTEDFGGQQKEQKELPKKEWEKYMNNSGGDYEKKYMKKYAGDYQKYAGDYQSYANYQKYYQKDSGDNQMDMKKQQRSSGRDQDQKSENKTAKAVFVAGKKLAPALRAAAASAEGVPQWQQYPNIMFLVAVLTLSVSLCAFVMLQLARKSHASQQNVYVQPPPSYV